MAKRKKLKSPSYTPKQQRVHDRRTTDLPYNAKIAVVEIDDPFALREFASHALARRRTGEATGTPSIELRSDGQPRLQVVRSLRDDPLAAMHARGQIDDPQFEGGRKWQFFHIRSELGALKGMDPSREYVDCVGFGDPTGFSRINAMDQLDRATEHLNEADKSGFGNRLVRKILGEGKTIALAADEFGLVRRIDRLRLGAQFRDCLDVLSVVFGCANRKKAA